MIFIRLTPEGQIKEVVERTTSPNLSSDLKEITNHPLARHAANCPEKYYFKDGELKAKTKVSLLPEKLVVKADGKDTVKVKIQTDHTEPIHLKVGLKSVVIQPNEELEITSDSLGIITIKLDDYCTWGSGISLYSEPVHES